MNIVFDKDSNPNEIYPVPIHTNDPEIYYIDDARFYRMGYNTLIGSMNFRIDIEKAIEKFEKPETSPFINYAFHTERHPDYMIIPMMFTAIPRMPDVPPLFCVAYTNGDISLDLAIVLSMIHTSEDIERYKEGYSSVRLHFSTFYLKTE